MSLAKVIEVIGEGSSIENATENAVKEATETIEDIKSIYLENIQAVVEGGNISRYRVNAKITFVLHHS